MAASTGGGKTRAAAGGAAKRARPRASLKDKLSRDNFFQTSPDLPRVVEIDLDRLRPNPQQPRVSFDESALDDLAESIRVHGLLQPVIAKRGEGGDYILIAGERRMRACKRLGRKTIAAILSDGDAGEIALIENLQRENLNPFEEALAIERLMQERGYSQSEIGRAIGKKQNTISALLSLNTLPERVRAEYPSADRVSKSWLIELAMIGEEAEQLRLWDRAKAAPVTVREIRAVRQSRPKPAAVTPADIARGSRNLLRRLGAVDPASLKSDSASRKSLVELHRALGAILGED